MQSTSQCQGVSTPIALTNFLFSSGPPPPPPPPPPTPIAPPTAANGLTAMMGRRPVGDVIIHKMGQLSQKRRCHLSKVQAGLKKAKEKRTASLREVLATNIEIGGMWERVCQNVWRFSPQAGAGARQ